MSSSRPQHRHQRSPPQAATPPASIADSRLGLSPEDVAALRQHQQRAHQQARSSAGSQASSQGRLLLDPGSLQLLSRHFDQILQAIGHRLEQLNQATEIYSERAQVGASNALQVADAEIARFHALLDQIDKLDTEFDKIKRLREIVRGFRARVEAMDRALGR